MAKRILDYIIIVKKGHLLSHWFIHRSTVPSISFKYIMFAYCYSTGNDGNINRNQNNKNSPVLDWTVSVRL